MATAAQTVQQQTFSPTRALGSDLAPPRLQYVTYVPAILAFTGILTWIVANNLGMILGSAVATAIAFYTLWEWLIRRGPTRFSTLLGMSLLLGYGFGTLNTLVTLPRGPLSLADFMGLDQAMLTRGIGAVLFATAPLYFLGEIFEKPLFGRDFRLHFDRKLRTLIYVGALAMLGGYFGHFLTFQGVVQSNGHVSIPGLFLSWLYSPLTALAVAAFLTAETRSDKLLGGIAAFVLLVLFSVTGRRVSIYTSLEIILVLGLTEYQWHGRIFRKLFLMSILASIVIASALTFMLLRISSVGNNHHKQLTVGERFRAADKMVRKGGAYELATVTTKQNAETRTFILTFFASVLDASARTTPALGEDVLGYLQVVTPTILAPDKNRSFSEEGLVDQHFGFSFGDQPNSIVTAGATDFGFVGVMVYPLLLVLLVRLLYDFISRWFRLIPRLFIVLSFVYLLLETENGLSAYFETLRDTALFAALLTLLLAMPGIRLRDS